MKSAHLGADRASRNRDYLARAKAIETVPANAVTMAPIAKKRTRSLSRSDALDILSTYRKKTTDAREETMDADLGANVESIGDANLRNASAHRRLSASDRKIGASRALALLEASVRTDDWTRAYKVVSLLLAQCTEQQLLPSLIARFLEQHWQRYLAQLYVNKDTRNHVWRDALEATATLIWSVQPKNDEANRKRFFARLPQLYQRLHEGLEMIGSAAHEKEEFFAELSRLHVESLHPRKGTNEAQQPNKSREHTSRAKPREHHRDMAVKEEDEKSDLAQTSDPCDSRPEAGRESTANASAESDKLPNFRIGSRVEFCGARNRKQLMSVKWISRNREIFLFKDHRTEHELCLTSARLNQHLSERAAVALD